MNISIHIEVDPNEEIAIPGLSEAMPAFAAEIIESTGISDDIMDEVCSRIRKRWPNIGTVGHQRVLYPRIVIMPWGKEDER